MLAPGTMVHWGASAWVLLPDQPSIDNCRKQVSRAVRESLSASAIYPGSLLNCSIVGAQSIRTAQVTSQTVHAFPRATGC